MKTFSLRLIPLTEAIAFSGYVCWYIWQLQEAAWYSWIVFPVWLIASFLLNRDTPRSIGWRSDNFWSATRLCSKILAPCTFAVVMLGLFLGGLHRSIVPLLEPRHFFGYMAFCLLQQVGLNSLVTNRLLASIGNPVRASLAAGLLFAMLHLPNPVLVPVTAIGGFLLAWLFAKERNILPLAIWQGILGALVWWAFPVAWHHAMRVGPGFYHFHPH